MVCFSEEERRMSNIRNVQWNEGAPEKLEPGMLVEAAMGGIYLCGSLVPNGSPEELSSLKRWAWLIQPHELNWLEDMASRKTRTQE